MPDNDHSLAAHYNLIFESRLSKAEADSIHIKKDIREIKRDLRWLLGLMISLNSTIIGILIKGFSL